MSTSGRLNDGSFRIAMLCVGDELLDGRTADRNAHRLGERCRREGWTLVETRVVPDVPETIIRSVRALVAISDLVVVSGGLGPTDDDRTREALAAAAGVPAVEDAGALRRLEARYAARGRTMAATNRRQAIFPTGATIFPSAYGTADPFVVPVDDTPVLSLPGVPREFDGLSDEILPQLAPTVVGEARASLTLFGIGESRIAEIVEDLDPPHVSIAYSARSPHVVLTLRGDGAAAARTALERALAPWALPDGASTVAEAVAARMVRDGTTIATAESCTGGLIASMLTDVPGASGWFGRGWVTYANAAKTDELGVRAELLAAHGAVSPPVAAAMARGARARADADVAVAVSGIAGPGGGTVEKPVGLVFLGVATRSGGVVVKARFRGVDRAGFKRATAALAMAAAFRTLGDDAIVFGGTTHRGPASLQFTRGVQWIRPIEEFAE